MSFWRRFTRSKTEISRDAGWWRDAESAAAAPSAERLTALRQTMTGEGDDRERQEEMVDGLGQLLHVTSLPALPVIPTRHRVIGDDVCHGMVPVTLADSPVSGKLFVTSSRLVFAGAGVTAWPWHRIRDVQRIERDLIVSVAGTDSPFHVRCNVYGEALVIHHLAKALSCR